MNWMTIKKAPAIRLAVCTLVAAALLSAAGTGLAAKSDYDRAITMRAINMAGMQRMLTQKMFKEFLLVALEIEKDRNLRDLQSTRELFARTVRGLREGDIALGLLPTTDPEILEKLARIEEVWALVDPAIRDGDAGETVSPEQVAVVADLTLLLLEAVNGAVEAYDQKATAGRAKTILGRAISLAGHQRMLIERMSKEVLLIAYGHQATKNRENLAESMALFNHTLSGLINGDPELRILPAPTPELQIQLKKVERIWGEIRPLIETVVQGGEADSKVVAQVTRINAPLLKTMNMAVFMYEGL